MADLKAIERALRAADEAGNVEDARRLAQAYADARRASPDFSNVRAVTTHSARGYAPPAAPVDTSPRDSLFRMDSDFRERAGVGIGDMLWASAKDMFGSRNGAAEYLAKKAGGQVVEGDNGPMIRLPDGSAYRLNDAGLDNADIANVAGNVAAAWLPASWATKVGQTRNLGIAGRMALQAGTAAATEAGLQAATDGGNVSAGRVGLAAAGGAGGELLGTGLAQLGNRGNAALRNFTGQNADDAAAVLAREGLNAPGKVDAAQLLAGADPRAIAGEGAFGFQYSLGQRLTDPARKFSQLSREELLRQTPGGHAAFNAMREGNAAKLEEVLTGMGERFGSRAAATPAEMVQGSAEGLARQADELRGRISAAYAKAAEGGRTAIGADAVAGLPDRLRRAVSQFDVNPTTTPATQRALDQLRQASNLGENVKGVTLKAIETQRRILNNSIGAAANPTDRAALQAVKGEFDGWLDDAVEGALVSGDPAALQALKDARALRAEFGRRFEGGKEADKFIQGLLDGSRTPEELLNIALGSSQVSKAGGARFIERLRLAANNDPGIMGGLRAAHFNRLTRGVDGGILDLAAIVRNVKRTQFNNASVTKALYTQPQWDEIWYLASSLEPMLAKGDFAKSSGTTERMARMLFSKMGGGMLGDALNGLTSGFKAVQAQRAIRAPVRPILPAPAWEPAAGGQGLDEVRR